MSEIPRLADQLERAFRGEAWSGPALLELVQQVDAPTAAAHPMENIHSIWEIVLHVTAWKHAVLVRLSGKAIEPKGREDWPPVPKFTDAEWQAAVRALNSAHDELLQTVRTLDEARLTRPVPGKDYDVYFMLHGVAQHDLYHAGQIAILKKSS